MTGSTGADLVITGGTVIDPTQDLHEARDVVIADGKIAALALPGAAPSAPRVLDAHGLLVTPGLIDLHTHVYLHVGEVNIDANSLAARSGTTTMVDAGSAGAAIFDGFRHYVAARARCRLLALLNISVIGAVASPMAGYGRFVDPTATAETVEANRDLIVGGEGARQPDSCRRGQYGSARVARARRRAGRRRAAHAPHRRSTAHHHPVHPDPRQG